MLSLKPASLSFLLMLFIGCASTQQDSSTAKESLPAATVIIIDSIVSLTLNNSIYAANQDWPAIKDSMYAIAAKHDSADIIGKPTEFMFQAIGDFHGMLLYNFEKAYSYRVEGVGPPRDSTSSRIFSEKMTDPYTITDTFLPDQKLAYLEVLGTRYMNREQIIAAAQLIKAKICQLHANDPVGWIIDLRCNTGGNMHPMFSGLAELFVTDSLGGDTKDGKNFATRLFFREGQFLENGTQYYDLPMDCGHSIDEQARVAVLVSEYTASSGEIVASSLKGLENVKLFGSKTGGLSTTNGWHPIGDKWVLAPAQAYYMSVDRSVHRDGIIPDVLIEEQLDLDKLLTNQAFTAAVKWLSNNN